MIDRPASYAQGRCGKAVQREERLWLPQCIRLPTRHQVQPAAEFAKSLGSPSDGQLEGTFPHIVAWDPESSSTSAVQVNTHIDRRWREHERPGTHEQEQPKTTHNRPNRQNKDAAS